MTIQFPHMPEQVTRSEAEIIDYISNNPREFLQDSIGAVSQKLGVSGTTLSREGRMILEYQKQAGYRTLSFTSRSYLPEPERADMNLFVYRGETKEYHSMTAPAALIDALVVAVSEKLGDEAVQRLSNLHRLKKAYDGNR